MIEHPTVYACSFSSFLTGNHEDSLENEEVEITQKTEEELHLKSTKRPSAAQRHSDKTNPEEDADTDTHHLSSNSDKHSSVRSVSSLRSHFNQRSSWRSAASSCEGAGTAGLTSSHGRLSSCSTVMIPEEQLMLNPVKPEVGRKHTHREYVVVFMCLICIFVTVLMLNSPHFTQYHQAR